MGWPSHFPRGIRQYLLDFYIMFGGACSCCMVVTGALLDRRKKKTQSERDSHEMESSRRGVSEGAENYKAPLVRRIWGFPKMEIPQ